MRLFIRNVKEFGTSHGDEYYVDQMQDLFSVPIFLENIPLTNLVYIKISPAHFMSVVLEIPDDYVPPELLECVVVKEDK